MAATTIPPGAGVMARRGRTRARLGPLGRFGLRARITAVFGLGALVLSALLAVLTYSFARESLVRTPERGAVRQVFLNARELRRNLPTGNPTEELRVSELLDSLQTPEGASPVLFRDGEWFPLDPLRGRTALPPALRRTVVGGTVARMRYDLDGETLLAIGTPMPSVQAAYFEIVSLGELEDTLNALGVSLLAAAALTTVAGGALGAFVSRRVLLPLRQVGDAAAAIAGGRLDTRVAAVSDPDLGGVITSFNDMARALQERIDRDTRFASDVSHELRSPLTTLAASVQVLETRRDELGDRGRSALDLLAADVSRFSAMVGDLLEISRIDAGAASLDLEPLRLGQLVRQSVAVSTDVDVPVRMEPGAAGASVQVDKRRLVRVIANLIDNAARYAGGTTAVSVSLHGASVRIAVEDNGPGVALEDRERIFERFNRGSGAGRRGGTDGTGLGLALVREHVRLHGGTVWVEGRGDGVDGARFVVELPVAQPSLPTEPEADLGPAAVLASEVDEVPV